MRWQVKLKEKCNEVQTLCKTQQEQHERDTALIGSLQEEQKQLAK